MDRRDVIPRLDRARLARLRVELSYYRPHDLRTLADYAPDPEVRRLAAGELARRDRQAGS